MGRTMQNGVSGWYARLDRCLNDRAEQINIWLAAWEESLKNHQPIAALLPEDWPTLPANLLTDPGHVLDHLLARHDAESDGRSPRGAHPTPPRLADSVITSEMLDTTIQPKVKKQTTNMHLADLPPGFQKHIKKLNFPPAEEEVTLDSDALEAVERGERTSSGIPLPFSDMSCGGGIFHARMLRKHSELFEGQDAELKKQDTMRLFRGFQLIDVDSLVVKSTKKRLLLESIRLDLVSMDGEQEGKVNRKDIEEILEQNVICSDALQHDWPWAESPRLIIANPPWLRIKDRFRGMEDGSQRRKNLSETLRNLKNDDGPRFSTMRGNVNLYRLFIERGMQILSETGQMRVVAPDSLLREQSSHPLRKLLVEKHSWREVWAIEEANLLFPGMTQGVAILGISSTPHGTETLNVIGPVTRSDLRRVGTGLSSRVPSFSLPRTRWVQWARNTWAVPRLPRDQIERKHILNILDNMSELPRLGDRDHWLATQEQTVKVRVGEIDQTAHSSNITSWDKARASRPFIRGVHFTEDEHGSVYIRHPAFRKDIPSRANERQLAMWSGVTEIQSYGPRLACQAIVNAHQERRLRWAVIPKGCILGNSVNHIEMNQAILNRLTATKGNLENALEWMCQQLNQRDLDDWAKAWSANNNVNNYELEMLPLQLETTQEVSGISME